MRISLNLEQRAAVEHGDGALLVLAGAGSGKTRVLTVRVADLIRRRGVAPERILAVTFTNKAAGEMRERIGGLLEQEVHGLWIGTFHSIAARVLRREAEHTTRDRAYSIYDEDDALRTLKAAMEQVGLDPKRWSPGAVRSRISDAKGALVSPNEYEPRAFDLLSRAVADVYPVYEGLLAMRNAYDFDDLLAESVRLLEGNAEVRRRYAARFRHVLVDEYQDTNHAQYRMVRALAREHGNICVVGDDDQAVYGWRGADIRNILEFERDFPGATVVRLEENYRSTAAILDVANAVIACNRNRKPKTLRTSRPAGEPIQVVRTRDERAEATWTAREIQALGDRWALGDCAVLYRTNAQSRAYEEAFRSSGLPYRIVAGVRFYERREVKDVLAYVQLAVNPADAAAFGRAVGWPRRGVGAVTLERLAAAAAERGESLLEAAAGATRIAELRPAAARSLEAFAAGIAELGELQRDASPRAVLEECVARFGLAAALQEEDDGEDRLRNVTELVAAAASFERSDAEDGDEAATDLELFLQSVTLRSEIDDVDLDAEAVTLMTLHNAKGLEFPVVFVGGLEEGLFPLVRAYESEGGLEEERRLFYVGVTRAMDRLYLTHAERRWRAGSASRSAPSSFLDELPAGPVEWRRAGGIGRGRRHDGGRTGSFGRVTAGRGAESGEPRSYDWRHDPTDAGNGSRAASGGTRRADVSGELEYDYADGQVPLDLSPGTRIVHPRFGEGRIVSLSGEGARAKAEIEFERVGRKKVMVAYAGLRPA